MTIFWNPAGPVVKYEDGNERGEYRTAQLAAKMAHILWPDQEQDEDRTGKGWDIEAVR